MDDATLGKSIGIEREKRAGEWTGESSRPAQDVATASQVGESVRANVDRACGVYVAGAAPSNTAPQTRQTAANDLPMHCSVGGYDTSYNFFHGRWEEGKWKALENMLGSLQRQAKMNEDATWETQFGVVEVQATRPSAGGRTCNFYVKWNGTDLFLSNHRDGGHCYCRIGSCVCMSEGVTACVERICSFLEFLGLDVLSTEQSEVHIRLDILDGEDLLDELVELAAASVGRSEYKQYILSPQSRVKVEQEEYGLTICIGGHGSEISACIYDKVEECLRKKEEGAFKIGVLAQLFGCDTSTIVNRKIMRCEFRLKREPLRRRFGVLTDLDLRDQYGEIARYCTEKFLTFVDRAIDRKNRHQDRSRQHVSRAWKIVREEFSKVSPRTMAMDVVARPTVPCDTQLQDQIMGCLIALAATQGFALTEQDVETLVQDVLIAWTKRNQERGRASLAERVKTRLTELRVELGEQTLRAQHEALLKRLKSREAADTLKRKPGSSQASRIWRNAA